MGKKLWTREEVERYCDGAIDLFVENVEEHGMDFADAWESALADTEEALNHDEEQAAGATPDLPFEKPEAPNA